MANHVERCAYCRRRAVDFGNGIKLLCRRHKNRKIDVTFHGVPWVIAPKVITAPAT